MRRLQIKCHLQNVGENKMKTNPWEHHVWLYPVIIAWLYCRNNFVQHLRVYKIISRATLEWFTQKTLNLVQLTREMKCMVVRQISQQHRHKNVQSLEKACKTAPVGPQDGQNPEHYLVGLSHMIAVCPEQELHIEIWVREECLGFIRFVTNSSPIHQQSCTARQTEYNLNLFGICNVSTDHDGLESAQAADKNKIHPFLQPAATGLQ